MDWKKLSVLITGGTGSFGQKFVEFLLRESPPRRIIIFSRDEFKQMEMRQRFPDTLDSPLRYFIGDVRDKERLFRAFRGVDVVVHAAALKQVPTAEYNPFEAVKTNVFGAQNVIDAAIDCGVEKVVALSTDKAVNPVNIYGATKLCAEKIFIQGNAYSGDGGPKFSCVRYGNVLGSRGSVLPLFNDQKKTGKITITDKRMTRFWITLDDAVELVIKAFWHMEGGEVFVPKIPSMRVIDLAKAIAPHCEIKVIGIRPGEKLHEVLVTEEEGRNTVTHDGKYVILPNLSYWKKRKYKDSHKVPEGFIYTSDKNNEWLTIEDLRRIVYDSSLCKEDSASSLLSTIHKLNEKIVLDMIDSEERPRSTELTAQSGDNR